MDYGGGDHYTADQGGVRLVGRRSVCGRSLSLRPIRLYARCLWHEQRRCSCGMQLVALYKCYMPLNLPTTSGDRFTMGSDEGDDSLKGPGFVRGPSV